MHGFKATEIASTTLTIADDTPATFNVNLSGKNQGGYIWVKLQTITATAGMSAVDVKWQPMGFKKDITSSDGSGLTATGSAVTLKTGADLQTAGDFLQYSLNNSAALNPDEENFLHADGVQISLTGDTDDDGTVWCSVWTWSY